MKKLLSILLCVVMCLSFVGCGNSDKQYYGTWDSVKVNIEGDSFLIEELEEMGDYSLSDFRIIIKENGSAYIYSEGNGTTLNWKKTDNGITVGVKECVLEDDFLLIENGDITIYLSKTSESQIIQAPESSEVNYNAKITLPTETGTYKYYSWDFHWSTVTVSDYNYEISEQSRSQLRIDFEFECTFDYFFNDAQSPSFNFYILVYDKDGNKIKDSIVNETDTEVGDTVTVRHTVLIDTDDVNDGIVIEFSGNN